MTSQVFLLFQLYGWTDGTITLFTLWGCLNFPVFFLPSAWLLGKSLKWSIIIGTHLFLMQNFVQVCCVCLLIVVNIYEKNPYCLTNVILLYLNFQILNLVLFFK